MENYICLNDREVQKILDHILFLSIIAVESIQERSGKDAIIEGSNDLSKMIGSKYDKPPEDKNEQR